jgi:hypothetical protein
LASFTCFKRDRRQKREGRKMDTVVVVAEGREGGVEDK